MYVCVCVCVCTGELVCVCVCVCVCACVCVCELQHMYNSIKLNTFSRRGPHGALFSPRPVTLCYVILSRASLNITAQPFAISR